MVKKRVLILIPTNSEKQYCVGNFIKNLKSLDLSNADVLFSDDSFTDEHKKCIEKQGFEVVKVEKTTSALRNPNSKLHIVQCLANARECLTKEFLKRTQYTHALWLDSDVLPPKNVVNQLLSNNVDIVSGVYWQIDHTPPGTPIQLYPVVYRYIENEAFEIGIKRYGQKMTVQELFPGRLIGAKNDYFHISAIGTGIVMMNRKVLSDENWHWRFDPTKPNTTEDMLFSVDITELGYLIHLDTRVCCRHLMMRWPTKIITKDTRK